ncbi:MAG: type II toxin-antitoxin system RelE/ParE family toxin [Leptolyngbyaceae cyanobacterium MO_188.B28]|nr:type II toxin-antitoxin system RelE/ParE family toxin [Leptolyngbyaceae cyanobacterium MO_188.B28]
MPNEPSKIQIEVTSEFKRSLRTLAKRYRKIRSDVQPIIDRLQAGEVIGDQISGTRYTVFKVRVINSNIQKGKSGGYRFIYYLKTSTQIILVTIYSKSDQGDVSADTINRIVANFESQ